MIDQLEKEQQPTADQHLIDRKLMEVQTNQLGSSRAAFQVVPSLLMQQTPLPTFDGRYENWYKFKDRFIDIVDKCVGDSPATKLHYLDKALVGKAAGAIDQQTLQDNNYDGAWRILTKRFENLRMVVQGHVTQLLSLKQMSKGTHGELRSLLDVVEKRIESLAFHDLKMKDKLSEAIVVNLLISKLDPDTRKAWEATVDHGDLPVYADTVDFLRNHCYMLERCEDSMMSGKSRGGNVSSARSGVPAAAPVKAHVASVQQSKCPVCDNDHLVEACEAFKKMSVSSRYAKAKQCGLCFGCLKRGHRTANCKMDTSRLCECQKRHHPLMHIDEKLEKVETAIGDTSAKQAAVGTAATKESPRIVATCAVPVLQNAVQKQVLLATAIVDVFDSSGVPQRCRALLDSGAMANFVSQRISDLLRLRKENVDIPVVGVNGTRMTVKFRVNATVRSRASDCVLSLDFLIVPRVTGALPGMQLDTSNWPIPDELQLADPGFFRSSRVDMLIGADVFYELMQAGKIRMSDELPLLQESLLGWLVAGSFNADRGVSSVKICQAEVNDRRDDHLSLLLERFWMIDDQMTEPLNDACERHFRASYTRGKDGRYIVQLPFKEDANRLGNSRDQAEKRFKALEKRLEKCPEVKKMYSDFVNEYIDLGHARVLDADEAKLGEGYYLPHHCVLKPDSSTTKLRVVFDASAKTTNDVSLNDILMDAPTVQKPLFDIILNWRLYKYVFTADVQRMYRQVMVNENDTKYQRCLWRGDRAQPIMDLELLTVTYGIGPAGFLATRCLLQLAEDEGERFPEASAVLTKAFYVDDALSGADTLEKAKQLREELQKLLNKGGFKLHKWCANNPQLLEGVPIEDREKHLSFEDNEVNGVIKTLGLLWDPVTDHFMFRVKPMTDMGIPTKREVLSEIARLFDPLGVLGPIVVLAKIVLQQLWRKNVDWDDPIPDEEFVVWSKLRTELCSVNNMKIPRLVTVDNPITFELHGFSDASTKAYGCCVYLKSITADGVGEVRLLCGKSRVAPLKESERKEKDGAMPAEMTVPRLELCAAVLLSRLIKTVRETLDVDINRIVLWSDSKIVICWLKRVKPEQSIFVKNRITEIQNLNPDSEWKYVNTKENPADLISRGVQPNELMCSELWWNGPDFLRVPYDALSTEVGDYEEQCVENSVVAGVAVVKDETNNPYEEILACSSFRKLQRIFAYVCRFIFNCRANKSDKKKRSGSIGLLDYRDSVYCMVRVVQRIVYRNEISRVQRGERVKGKLTNLNPIFDEEERLLRVGGRIHYSDLPRDQKHPMIIPENHHFTNIIIETLHREQLHVGQNGLLAKIREQFWPVNAKRTINRVLRKCVRCFRVNPKDVQQFMGDLPSARVTIAPPFERTGVDYAGPFLIKRGRSKAPTKAYVCLFVCMCTKAIHLELVNSMTTEGFLGALQRFVGRRGNVSDIYSDNGSNFIGAKRELQEFLHLLKSQILEEKVATFCQPRGINWHFMPPRAPHQGGLWEAGVKAMKTHMYRTLKEAYLTYEEMCTLLVQIEAILNSRPLVEQSNNPTDFRALSPGHFLVGRELSRPTLT